MTNNKVNAKKIVLWVLVITAFMQLRPYFVWSTYGGGRLSLLTKAILFVSLISTTIYLLGEHRKININIVVTIVFLIVVQMYMLVVGSDYTDLLSIGNYIVLLIMISFFLLSEQEKKFVFDKFKFIFAISLISGIIVWVAINIGIQLPYENLQSEHVGKAALGAFYKKYFGSAFLYFTDTKLVRLSAMYDEPGVVGTFSALFLIADDFRLKHKLSNIIILTGGLLSFSMAFYILILIGIVIKAFTKRSYKLTFVLIAGLILFQSLMTIQTDNIFIENFFKKRFQIVDGNVVGDNRASESFNYEYNQFIQGDITKVLFGYGNNAAQNNPAMYGSYTYKMLIYDFGITGFIMFLLWIIYATATLTGFNKKCMILMLVFIISIYQRPYVLTLPYIFLLLGGYANLMNMKNLDEKSKGMVGVQD